jgi:hypothetical protein
VPDLHLPRLEVVRHGHADVIEGAKKVDDFAAEVASMVG